MVWIAVYGALALIVSVAAFLLSEWARQPEVPAPRRPGVLAIIAGLLWPVVVLGLLEWWLIAVYGSPSATPGEPIDAARELNQVA